MLYLFGRENICEGKEFYDFSSFDKYKFCCSLLVSLKSSLIFLKQNYMVYHENYIKVQMHKRKILTSKV